MDKKRIVMTEGKRNIIASLLHGDMEIDVPQDRESPSKTKRT